MFDQRGYEVSDPEGADDFPASNPWDTVPTDDPGSAGIKRIHRNAVRKTRGKKARFWRRGDIVVTITPPTHEELRDMVGCVDRDEVERRRRGVLLETGIRRRHPGLAGGRLEAVVARVARALSPPPPPGDSDWEGIRRQRASHPPRSQATPSMP
jgi:hypothetical protein